MAETIVLEDGSHAVLLTDPNKIEDRGPELLQLIRDKLGADAARAFTGYIVTLETPAEDPDLPSYEASLESNLNAFLDIQAEAQVIALALQAPRLDRRKIDQATRQIQKIINNQI